MMCCRLLIFSLLLALLQGCHGPPVRSTNDAETLPSPSTTLGAPTIDPANVQSITRLEPGTNIQAIKSDPFRIVSVSLRGNVLKFEVDYAGGMVEHDFELYWSGISTRSLPPQYPMILKHNKNNDSGTVPLIDTVYFDVSELPRPFVIRVATDHGDAVKIDAH